MADTEGRLYIVATPIGNLEDISMRAVRLLGEVDAVACEDTRVTRVIFERYGISRPATIFSYHEHNEHRAARKILDLVARGLSVALCTNAGTPGISDPGYRVMAALAEQGRPVEVVPGPSAVTTALLASGLHTSSYTFKGFPPRKGGPRRRFLEADRDSAHTLVFFESPLRIGFLLAEAVDVYGDRLAAVCFELTKKFERVHRGFLSELAHQLGEATIKGEVTLVIAGNTPTFIKKPAGAPDTGSREP